jgi:hypothetical protein
MRILPVLIVAMVGCGRPSVSEPVEPGISQRLTLNDVSFLWPLPPPPDLGTLLRVDGVDTQSVFLPPSVANGLPELVEAVDQTRVMGELRVVSARIDPCFPGSAPPAPASCRKQIRLVVQPVFVHENAVTTRDATLHLFYELPDDAFFEVERVLFELDERAGEETDGPLDVHPVLAREKGQGPYTRTLRTLIETWCGPGTLVRVAFMSVNRDGDTWRFGAFNVSHSTLMADPIPRLSTLTVQAFQELGTETFRNGALIPPAPNDPLDTLLSESALRFADERTLGKALSSALRIEHPSRTSPKTIDCASCHVASRARRHAETSRRVDSSGHPDLFTDSEFDLTRRDGARDNPKALRAFGYFGRLSAFSQRTINESAAVARLLESQRP